MKRMLWGLVASLIMLTGCPAPAGEQLGADSSTASDAAAAPDEALAANEALTEVLGGRLYVDLPGDMHIYNGKDDINIDATSFSFANDQPLYPYGKPNLYFAELYAVSTGDIRKDAELFNQRKLLYYQYQAVFDQEPIQYENGLTVLVGTPQAHDIHEALQKIALIKMPDDTLIALLLSTSDDMADGQEALDTLFDSVTASMVPGGKPLDLERHPVTFGGKHTRYEAICPEGYILTSIRQEWVELYTFTKVDTIDQNETSLVLYTDYFYYGINEGFDEPEGPYVTKEDTLFGTPVTWRIYTLDNGSYRACVYIDFELDDKQMKYYIKATYAEEADWDVMRAIFETI